MPKQQKRNWAVIAASLFTLALIALLVSFAGRTRATSGDWQQRLSSPELSPSDFTAILAAAAREALPEYRVSVVGQLEIEIVGEGTASCYLDNLCSKSVRIRNAVWNMFYTT